MRTFRSVAGGALPALLLAALAACDSSSAAPRGAVSAGVLPGAELDVPGWTLERLARIEGESDDPDALLYNAGSVASGPDGRLYVLNHGDARVAVYDAQGRFEGALAKKGKGPGQLTSPMGVAVRGDTVYVLETVPARLLRFRRADGVFIDNVDLQAKRLIPLQLAVAPDGRMAVEFHQAVVSTDDNRAARPLVAWVDPASGEVTPVVELDSVVRMRANTKSSGGGSRSAIGAPPFSAKPVWTFDGAGDILFGNGAEYAVWRMRGGKRELAFRAEAEQLPVTAEDIEQYTANSYASKLGAKLEFPDRKPFYAGLKVDGEGDVWVFRHGFGGAGTWEIRRPDGTRRGELRLPSGTRLLRLDGDTAYLVQRDEMDVESLVQVRVKKS
ncbi:MAG TPA: 6-bladed beta-propeller [Longimicrobium sp.]|nr:6-bladed beta-propeller [Longimicrobium sp.]